MADITGPISTLPGAHYGVPAGTMCDDHPDRPATHRVQGETDSFGCEMHDLCDDCYVEYKAGGEYSPDKCDWCKQQADNIRPTRDYDEGTCGPVYYVCKACRDRRDKEAQEEDSYYDDYYDDWDEPENPFRIDGDAWAEGEAVPVLMAPTYCKACRRPWSPGHKCSAGQVKAE